MIEDEKILKCFLGVQNRAYGSWIYNTVKFATSYRITL